MGEQIEAKFDATVSKVDVKPAKLDKDELEVHPQYATLSLNIPMDSLSQSNSVKALLDVMKKEFVKVTITSEQLRAAVQASD